jgi:hypothetical protein
VTSTLATECVVNAENSMSVTFVKMTSTEEPLTGMSPTRLTTIREALQLPSVTKKLASKLNELPVYTDGLTAMGVIKKNTVEEMTELVIPVPKAVTAPSGIVNTMSSGNG